MQSKEGAARYHVAANASLLQATANFVGNAFFGYTLLLSSTRLTVAR